MTDDIFTNWDDAHTQAYGRAPFTVNHDLHRSSLFDDDGLANLLDTFPRDRLGIYTMGDDPTRWKTFVRGTAGDLSGAELVKAVKTGRFWMNLRAVNSEIDAYGDLCNRMFAALDARTGQKTLKHDLGVLISSPKAQVFYHLDIPLVTLWQVRGVKRVWIYPESPSFAPDKAIEGVVLRETEEEFEYAASYDEDAFVVDLEPGMMASWPQNAPHRIVNHDMMNVSLSVEYMSWPALARANMLYTNGVLRRKMGMTPDRTRDTGARLWIKAALARALKLGGGRQVFRKETPISFRVDPEREGGVAFLDRPLEVSA